MRLVHEILHLRSEPVISARGSIVAAHSLLNNRPFTFDREEKAVVINSKTVLHCSRVDFGRHAAVVCEAGAVHPEPVSICDELCGSAPRDFTLSAGHKNSQLMLARGEAFLERPADCGRDPARVPVKPENAAERLKPVRVREALQEGRAAVLEDYDLRDGRRELGHAIEEPPRSLAPMERKGGATCTLRH